jgi:hypothetical protein
MERERKPSHERLKPEGMAKSSQVEEWKKEREGRKGKEKT